MYYIVSSGSSSMMGGDVTMGIMLVDKAGRDRSAFEIEDDLRENLQDIAGCEITVSASSTVSMGSGDDINVEITGDDYDTLELISNDLTAQIAQLPDAVDVDNSLSERSPR